MMVTVSIYSNFLLQSSAAWISAAALLPFSFYAIPSPTVTSIADSRIGLRHVEATPACAVKQLDFNAKYHLQNLNQPVTSRPESTLY